MEEEIENLFKNLDKEIEHIKSQVGTMIKFDKTKSEIENINMIADYVDSNTIIVYIFENPKGEQIFLQHPELMTISDYPSFKQCGEPIEMVYDHDSHCYRNGLLNLKEFDDLYHATAPMKPGSYKIRLKRREAQKLKGGKVLSSKTQFCIEPKNVKRMHVYRFSCTRWDECYGKRVVSNNGVSLYFVDEEEVFPIDL
jgi:hypothetical protein